jgi:hypothetical protein
MLGGETGEIIFGKLSKNLGIRAKRIPNWFIERVQTLRLLL